VDALGAVRGYAPYRDHRQRGTRHVTGLLSEVNPELAHGVFHAMEGWVIFTVAGVMLAALHLCINGLVRRRRLLA